MIFEPGVRADIAHADYLAIDAFSSSGAKLLLQSPMHFLHAKMTPRAGTEAQDLGTALHMALLEPDRFETDVLTIPEDAPARATAAQVNAKKPSDKAVHAIDWWADWDARAAGRLTLSVEQRAIVDGMADSVRSHPAAAEYLRDGRSELTLQWRDAKLGIPCKCRFDYLRDDGIALDIKSTRDASADAFARSVSSFGYHIQAAHYGNGHEHLLGASLRAFLFVAVENTAPFGCAVYLLEDNAIRFAVDRVAEAMRLYAEATATGDWPGYPDTIQRLVLPRWATTISQPTY